MPFRAVLAALPGLVLAGMAGAQPQTLQIVSAERPPYVYDTEGTGSGPAVDLVLKVVPADLAERQVRILPFQRAVLALDSGGTVYPALLRTPPREARYQWIGEVFEDRAVLFTLAPQPPVGSVGAARQLDRISVMRGSELQVLLQSFALPNVESNIAEADNARLLQAGRIDGWFTLRTVGQATWRLLGFAPRALKAGEPFAMMSFWIAASADLPAATVGRLRAAYDRLRRSGEYGRIVAPLREPPA